jgi:hypothetical protein
MDDVEPVTHLMIVAEVIWVMLGQGGSQRRNAKIPFGMCESKDKGKEGMKLFRRDSPNLRDQVKVRVGGDNPLDAVVDHGGRVDGVARSEIPVLVHEG